MIKQLINRVLISVFTFAVSNATAQQSRDGVIDSLANVVSTHIEVKQRIKAALTIVKKLYREDTVKTALYLKIASQMSDSIDYLPGKLDVIGMTARILTEKGKLDEAVSNLLVGENLAKEAGELEGLGDLMIDLGNIYDIKGDKEKALSYYIEAVKAFEEISHSNGIGMANMGLGNIYYELERFDEAIKCYRKSYLKLEEIKSEYSSWSINNLASVFVEIDKLDSAIYYFEKSLKLKEKYGDDYGASYTYMDLGGVYLKQGNYQKARYNLEKSLEIKLAIPGISQESIANSLLELGDVYLMLKNEKEALLNYKKALDKAIQSESQSALLQSYQSLAKVYRKMGDNNRAFFYLEKYAAVADSVYKINNVDALAKLQTEYETAEKEHQIQLLDKENKLLDQENEVHKLKKIEADLESERKDTMLLGTLVAIILLVVVVFIAIRNSQIKKRNNLALKQMNQEIEEQKLEVEEKNREITDSITYAKRIQLAILPSEKIVKESLKDSFILYKPKDIVAGDFYWIEAVGNQVLFAAADCTGHGVPGAMVSVVCNNALNRSVRECNLTKPNEILDKTREIVIQEFEKSEEDVKDGMDIALCSLRFEVQGSKLKKTTSTKNPSTSNPQPPTIASLQYAGAHNPLWIIRDGKILETKADKQPIGKFIKQTPFTMQAVELQKGDTIYIFSDGYVDQFGGKKGKKFKAKAFRELLLSIQDFTMEEQKKIINDSFEKWRGGLEQIDDVCVVGVRI